MKTCFQCGRSYPDALLSCAACGLPLPKGEAADTLTVAHINYLLGELPQWVMAGWLEPAQARRLGTQYEQRRDQILAGGAVPVDWAALSAPPPPRGPAPASPPNRVGIRSPRAAPLAAFREDRSLGYWLLIGALLLLAGVLASVIWAWESSSGRLPVFTLLLALTGGFAVLARSSIVREERLTSTVLTTIAALLVPLDLYVGNAFLLVGGRLNNEGMGLLTTLACLPLYAWLARRGGRTFLVLFALDLSAGLHFLLHAILPPLLHTQSALRLTSAYGPVYMLLAALYLRPATATKPGEVRDVWRGLMHVTAGAAVAGSLYTGALTTFGPASATFLAAGALYAAAAMRLSRPVLATLGTALTVLGADLGLQAAHVSPGSQWYVYVLTALAIAAGLRAAAARVRDGAVGAAFAQGALAVAWLAVIGQAFRAAASLDAFPAFSLAGTQLWGALACAALTGAFFVWAGSRGMADVLLSYGVVLLGLLAAHAARWAEPGNAGLSLAVAAAILWAQRREESARACAWVALAVCGAYALHGGFLGTNTLALLVLIGLWAPSLWIGGAAGSVWLALAAATGITLMWESHVLPGAQAHGGLEPNNGYGLFLLTVACLGLYGRRRDAALLQGAAALGVGNAALQLVYAAHGTLPYSPLALLGAGMALCAAIAWSRRSERFALWATTLAAYAYLTYVAGLLAASLPGREGLTAGLLLLSAAALAAVATRVPRPFLAYAAPLAAALGWAHGVHRLWHPGAVEYPLALLPLVAAFFTVAVLRARREDDPWSEALHDTALAVSALALVPCAGAFLWPIAAGYVGAVTASLLLYGTLFGGVAWLRRSAVTLYAAATLLNAAYLCGLLHHTPALTRPLIALWLGLAGLAWLGAASLWQRAAVGIASLFPVAAGVALVTAGVALTDMHGDYSLYALLIAGTTFTGIAWGVGQSNWVHLGICTFLLAYISWLWERIGAPGLPNGDYFLIPVGLYAVALGVLARRGMLDANAPPFYLAGLLLILTPTYLAAREPTAGLPHALLLAAECLAAIFYGLTGRIKVFLATGTVFLLLWIQLSLRAATGQGSWAISALLLGMTIIGSALYLEKRRDKRAGWPQAAQHEWRRWE